jgi:hypothetical protein
MVSGISILLLKYRYKLNIRRLFLISINLIYLHAKHKVTNQKFFFYKSMFSFKFSINFYIISYQKKTNRILDMKEIHVRKRTYTCSIFVLDTLFKL